MSGTRPSKVVVDAAMNLVVTLAGDEAFVSAVTEQEIGRRVALGELVPRERLQITAGLELAPAGRLGALEAAAWAVLKYSEAMPPEQTWTDEERFLQAAIHQLAVILRDGDQDDEEEDDDVEKGDDVSPGASTTRTTAPEKDDTGPCEECGQPIDTPGQARLSWQRWRRVLCIADHRLEPSRRIDTSTGPDVAPAAEEPAEGPAEEDE